MTEDSMRERARNDASGIAAVVVTGTWLALLMLGAPSEIWLAVMLFGYIAVVPVLSILFEKEGEDAEQDEWQSSSETSEQSEETPLERLRRRYADGELTDEQFERKLERLLETETLEDVEERTLETDRTEGNRPTEEHTLQTDNNRSKEMESE